MYNPDALRITNIHITNYSWSNASLGTGYGITGGKIQGSSNGSSWIDLKTFTNSTTALSAQWDISMTNNTSAYKYHRLYITSHHSSAYGGYNFIGDIKLTAYTKTQVSNSITFPTAYQHYYSPQISFYGGKSNDTYIKTISLTNMTLENLADSGTTGKWITVGY